MRTKLLTLLGPAAVIVGVVAFLILTRETTFGRPGVWEHTQGNLILEFKSGGELDVDHWNCENWAAGDAVTTSVYRVEHEDNAFVFPEQQARQSYRMVSALLPGVEEEVEAFRVEEAGPIPSGTYAYREFYPIGMCGLTK